MSQIFDLALLCLVYMFHNINCEWVENKGLWYYISASELSVNYDNAVDICDSLNARLVVITDNDQNEFLKENNNDGKSRWIGLSNDKNMTLYPQRYCNSAVYVWNNDWYCDITYSNFENDNHKGKHIRCSGVAFSNGKWTAEDCSENHGFICQWECKRIYMHFESTEYSGVYTFGENYNNNFRYYKEGDRDYRIYISTNYDTWVVVKDNEEEKIYKYFHEADLYVPYKEGMSWTTDAGYSINSGLFCVECDNLSICKTFPRQTEEFCFNDMRLSNDSLYPRYTNNDESAVIRYDPDGDTGNQCIAITPIGLEEIQKCGYLIPNPRKTTNYTFKHNMYRVSISIINNCNRHNIETPATSVSSSTAQSTGAYISQPTLTIDETEKQTTLTFDTTSKPASAQKSTQNNGIITLSVSIAAVIIAIIIVAVIMSIIFVRRRKRKGQNDEDPGGMNTRHDHSMDAQFNNNAYLGLQESNTPNNVYSELQGSNLKNAVESNSMQNITDLPKKHFNGGDYSYAKFVTPGTGQVSKERVKTSTLEEKPPIATTNEVALNKGYLAPDYGILMDRNDKQADKGHANNNIGTNAVYLETNDSKAKSISPSPGASGSDYDLQLHENEVYDTSADSTRPNNPKNENVYYSDVNADVDHGIDPRSKQSNEGSVYKNAISDTIEEGDDDLELFENSVYEHTH